MILKLWTDRCWQTAQTQIRLQSGQGLQCLHLSDTLLGGKTTFEPAHGIMVLIT